jgi:hypothetical protein
MATDVEVTVAGIPAIARVRSYHRDGDGWGEPRTVEIYYTLLDRKGYRARWLDGKVTAKVDDAICEQIMGVLG